MVLKRNQDPVIKEKWKLLQVEGGRAWYTSMDKKGKSV